MCLVATVPLEVSKMHGVGEVDLLSVTNEAKYILLTTHDFLAAVEPLIDRRKAQGLKTMFRLSQIYLVLL